MGYLFKEYRLVLSWVLKEVFLTERAAIFSDQVVLLISHCTIHLLRVCTNVVQIYKCALIHICNCLATKVFTGKFLATG